MCPGNSNGEAGHSWISALEISVSCRAEDKNCFFLQLFLILYHSFYLLKVVIPWRQFFTVNRIMELRKIIT